MYSTASANAPAAKTSGAAAANDPFSVYMGDIEPWMDENFLFGLFSHTGEVSHVRVIRDKATQQPAGYAFVHCVSDAAMRHLIDTFNGQTIPNTTKTFRLAPAQHGSKEERQSGGGGGSSNNASGANITPYGLWVGDLAPDVNDYTLLSTFQYYYPSVVRAKVVMDTTTNMSKGFGFVNFGNETEYTRALTEMNGFYIGYRPIRVSTAQKKGEPAGTGYGAVPGQLAAPPAAYGAYGRGAQGYPASGYPGYPPAAYPGYPSYPGYPPYPAPAAAPAAPAPVPAHFLVPARPAANTQPVAPPTDNTNVTVFVGGIDASVSHDLLRSGFQGFGEITQVKVPVGKGCAFIEFATHEGADKALTALGTIAILGNGTQMRLAWGNQRKKQGESLAQQQSTEQVLTGAPTSSGTTNGSDAQSSASTEDPTNDPLDAPNDPLDGNNDPEGSSATGKRKAESDPSTDGYGNSGNGENNDPLSPSENGDGDEESVSLKKRRTESDEQQSEESSPV